MISLWEKQSLLSYDVVIVGAGITGLSTAISLKEKRPGLKVLVLEKGLLPSGASTKNAGFACFGSVSELLNDLELLGEQGMLDLVIKRWEGLHLTRRRLGDKKIGFEQKSGYELVLKDSTLLDQMGRINDILFPYFKKIVFRESEKLKNFGFGNTRYLIENLLEGQLDTGELMSHLWQLAMQKGVKIITGAEVMEVTSKEVVTATHSFQTRVTAICTNAFSKKIIPDIDLEPGRGMVLSVVPERPLRFQGTFHYDEGYYYFRDYHGKLIFGGGRNLDFETEKTLEFDINQKIEKKLFESLDQIILPDTKWHVEMKWAGIMAFGKTKAPVIQKVDNKIYAGVRLGGMGVALGSKVGEDLSSRIISEAL